VALDERTQVDEGDNAVKNLTPIPATVQVKSDEIAYALTELGDAIAAMKKKVYSVSLDRIVTVSRRLRFWLNVEGKEERE
jgi:hypothetical protein